MDKNMFLSFRKRLKKVCEKQQKVIDKLDVVDLQFSHWIEKELTAPPKLVEVYNKATDFVNQFDEMIANAWYSVREFHIHLSGLQGDGLVRDGLERAHGRAGQSRHRILGREERALRLDALPQRHGQLGILRPDAE